MTNLMYQTWTTRKLTVPEAVPSVLVADDYSSAAEALASFLALEGVDARVALGGNEALLAVQHWLPAVIILDIQMPGRDGISTASQLRSNPATAAVGIVAFTSLEGREVSQRASPGDFDGYCQKGVSPALLLGLLRALWTA
jgi:two-component system OmpR family response regulator